jgi:branched-chain amino acid transport system substrate-binding protein
MLKRMSVTLTAAAMLLTTAACGGTKSNAGAGSAQGLKGSPVLVAVVLPLTGASAKTAEQMANAAKLAAAKVNADGGIGGRPLEIKVYDDQLKPENATQEVQRALTRDRAIAVVGAQSSGEALAIREVVERSKVPFITSSATVEAITKGATYTYRIAPVLTDYANGVVDIAKAIGLKDPAVVHDSGGAGVLLKDLFLARAKADSLPLAGAPIEYELNGTDMSAQVSAAAKHKPDGVLIGGSAGGDHGLVAKTMVEQGLNVPLIGFSPILVSDAVKIGGDAYKKLPAVYSLQNLDQQKPSFKDFQARYTAKYGAADLTEQPAQTWDSIMVLAQALSKTAGKGGDALKDALNGTSAYEGVSGRAGTAIQFSATRHNGFEGKYLVAYKMNGPKAVQSDLKF